MVLGMRVDERVMGTSPSCRKGRQPSLDGQSGGKQPVTLWFIGVCHLVESRRGANAKCVTRGGPGDGLVCVCSLPVKPKESCSRF